MVALMDLAKAWVVRAPERGEMKRDRGATTPSTTHADVVSRSPASSTSAVGRPAEMAASSAARTTQSAGAPSSSKTISAVWRRAAAVAEVGSDSISGCSAHDSHRSLCSPCRSSEAKTDSSRTPEAE